MKTPSTLPLFLCCFTAVYASRVLELSDKFSHIRKDGGYWLVMFYAPWCGHCKRLEPVWSHVAQALARNPIRVGKIDCTRFTNLAKEFQVGRFPTIKFIKPEEDHTFNGDRTKEDIINFALRMSGPPVQEITRAESISTIKGSNRLFFMYVGEQTGSLWDSFSSAATRLQPHAFFYTTTAELAKQSSIDVDDIPAVFVYKDGLHHFFSEEDTSEGYLNDTVFDWLNEERFETFPKVTRGNINEFLQTKKFIVLAVVEENKLGHVATRMAEFRDTVESVVRNKRDKYHKKFQFGWTGSPSLANSIAMTVLPLPYLLVLNSTTNHHHLPEDEPTSFTEETIDLFLETVCNESATVYGGNSIPVQMYRAYFEAKTSLGDMWQGNPVLTAVLFGLPFGFLSLIVYSMCCQDIMDAEDEEKEELLHEKKE